MLLFAKSPSYNRIPPFPFKIPIFSKKGIRGAILCCEVSTTVLAPIIINLMTGSMVIEKICSIPGLGSLLVGAIQGNDCYVVMAVAFLYSLLYVIMMLVVDILYGIIDPRIRVSKED